MARPQMELFGTSVDSLIIYATFFLLMGHLGDSVHAPRLYIASVTFFEWDACDTRSMLLACTLPLWLVF